MCNTKSHLCGILAKVAAAVISRIELNIAVVNKALDILQW